MIFCKTFRIFLFGVLVTSCSEWDFKPIEFTQIVTVGVINVGSTSAVLLGDIQNLRKSDMEETGFLLSTSHINENDFRLDNAQILRVQSSGRQPIDENRAFAASASNLLSGTAYFFRAYGLLANEDQALYGEIDSFTTTGFNILIESLRRNNGGCPTQASIELNLDVKGVPLSAVQFGIAWHLDLISEPTIDGQVVMGDQVSPEGSATILLPVTCDVPYRVRPFVRSPEDEIFYSRSIEFTTTSGGVWYHLGEIPQHFERSQGVLSLSSDQHGYLIGYKKDVLFESTSWKFDPKNQNWSEFSDIPGGYKNITWAPSTDDRALAASGSLLYEYLPNLDEWKFLGDYPGGFLQKRVGFVFENKMYFVRQGTLGSVQLSDPDIFQPLREFPGSERVSFVIEDQGYLGLGTLSMNPIVLDNIWKFDLPTEALEVIAEFPAQVQIDIAFSMSGKGYMLTGVDEDSTPYPGFWEYDPKNDQWERLTDFGRGDGNADFGFVIDGTAYAGLGESIEGAERQDFWKYIPELR